MRTPSIWVKSILVSFLLMAPTGRTALASAEEVHFPIHVSESQTVEATVRLPKGPYLERQVPVFLIFGGFESAGHVLDLIHPNKPVALASFDYPFSASRDLRIHDGLKILREGNSLFPKTVRGIIDLVDHLKGMSEIDPRRIVAIGASFGSPFVLAAAARDPDISSIVLIDAFGRVPETADHVILRSWLPRYGWMSRPAAWLIARLAWFYLSVEPPETDAERLLKITGT